MEGSAEYASYHFMDAVLGINLTRNLSRPEWAAKNFTGSLEDLEIGARFYKTRQSYKIGAYATHLLAEHAGPKSVADFYDRLSNFRNWERAFDRAFGITPEESYKRFPEPHSG